MTKGERKEQKILLRLVSVSSFGVGIESEWRWEWVGATVGGEPLDRVLESAAYAWTDGPES